MTYAEELSVCKRLWIILICFLCAGAGPARAENLVFKEFMSIAPQGKSPPDGIEIFEQYFEELDTLSLDEYKLFPMARPDDEVLIDRSVYILKNDAARKQICVEVRRALLEAGPKAFTMQVFGNFIASMAQHSSKGEPEITAEAIVAYQFAKLELECKEEADAE